MLTIVTRHISLLYVILSWRAIESNRLIHLYVNGADMGIEMNLLAEAGLADPAGERPFLVMNRANVLLQWAFVGRRVVAERTNEWLHIFVHVFDVSFKVDLLREVGATGLANVRPVFDAACFCNARPRWDDRRHRCSSGWVAGRVRPRIRVTVVVKFATVDATDVLQDFLLARCRIVADVAPWICLDWRRLRQTNLSQIPKK